MSHTKEIEFEVHGLDIGIGKLGTNYIIKATATRKRPLWQRLLCCCCHPKAREYTLVRPVWHAQSQAFIDLILNLRGKPIVRVFSIKDIALVDQINGTIAHG